MTLLIDVDRFASKLHVQFEMSALRFFFMERKGHSDMKGHEAGDVVKGFTIRKRQSFSCFALPGYLVAVHEYYSHIRSITYSSESQNGQRLNVKSKDAGT